jgi:hypothetical protein
MGAIPQMSLQFLICLMTRGGHLCHWQWHIWDYKFFQWHTTDFPKIWRIIPKTIRSFSSGRWKDYIYTVNVSGRGARAAARAGSSATFLDQLVEPPRRAGAAYVHSRRRGGERVLAPEGGSGSKWYTRSKLCICTTYTADIFLNVDVLESPSSMYVCTLSVLK